MAIYFHVKDKGDVFMLKQAGRLYTFSGAFMLLIGSPFFLIGVWMALNMDYVRAHSEGDAWILPIAFMGLGGLVIVIGVSILLSVVRRIRKNRRLFENNQFVWATVVDVVDDYSITINRRGGSRVIAEWTDESTGLTYSFSSDIVFSNIVGYPEGYKVQVFVDPDSDYQDYVMVLDRT